MLKEQRNEPSFAEVRQAIRSQPAVMSPQVDVARGLCMAAEDARDWLDALNAVGQPRASLNAQLDDDQRGLLLARYEDCWQGRGQELPTGRLSSPDRGQGGARKLSITASSHGRRAMPNTVFISHAADDPDWPEPDVCALADQIKHTGADVLLDYWHRKAKRRNLSEAEWRKWMRSSLETATHILILSSPLYVERVDDPKANIQRGKGVALEASYLDQALYDAKQANEGWMSLCFARADVRAQSVPKFLKGACPEYQLPREQAELLEAMTVAECGACEPPNAPAAAPQEVLLEPADAPLRDWLAAPARAALRQALQQACPSTGAPLRLIHHPLQSAQDFSTQFINQLVASQGDAIFGAMGQILDALDELAKGKDDALRKELQGRQLAFYRLLVRGVVQAAQAKLPLQPGVSLAPCADVNLCALLAGELFKGELVYDYQEHARAWVPRWVFAVSSPANGEKVADALERAIYTRLMPASGANALLATVQASAESAPLSAQERSDLKLMVSRRAKRLNAVVAVIDPRCLEGTPLDVASQHAAQINQQLGVNVLLPQCEGEPRAQLCVDQVALISQLRLLLGDYFDPQWGTSTHPGSPA